VVQPATWLQLPAVLQPFGPGTTLRLLRAYRTTQLSLLLVSQTYQLVMAYPEEAIAHSLLRDLESALDPRCLGVEGAGVHWHCFAQKGSRRSETACFSTSGPEYLTEFQENGVTAGWGRTTSSTETVNAVARWIGGELLETMYREFQFVDANRRALEGLLRAAMTAKPELEAGTQSILQRDMCDLHRLTLVAGDRSVVVTFYGKNENPDAYLRWDGCIVAQARVVPSEFGSLLERWLIARELPSELTAYHHYVRVRPVARFYEAGRGVEGEFIVSWDELETFYRESQFSQSSFALQFLASLRKHGFDRTLRAGQSLWRTIVSRSRRHGLASGQVSVMFDFQVDHVKVSGTLANRTVDEVAHYAPEAPQEVVSLLRDLEAHPIDGDGGAG
jgi:hypothetical protein